MANRRLNVDIIIFGGGIAGLWTLARLLKAGYSAVLLETETIGGVQSIASQGIIHGGTKYALTGKLSDSARAIADMPEIWRSALTGQGELDLRGAQTVAEHQYLWSTEGLLSRMTGFFASKAMRSKMQQLKGSERPSLFQDPVFKGVVYQLNEPVFDIPSLMRRLQTLCAGHLFQLNDVTELSAGGCRLGEIELRAKQMILSAGRGNAALLKQLGRQQPKMQLRPLHMVMLRGDLPPLHAHALGASANPRLTVTSYPLADGEQVWSLGGEVAEQGNARDREAQIAAAKSLVAELLPWLDQRGLKWATYRVDRAEIETAGGKRPDGCYVGLDQGVITVWPTKLAFAPRVAQEVLALLQASQIQPESCDLSVLASLPQPALALPPWEAVESWS